MDPNKSKKGFDFDPLDLSEIFPQSKDVEIPDVTGHGPATDSDDKAEHDNEIIDNIFRKMQQQGDFPTFSKQILEVNTILSADLSSAKQISDVIMKDFSLTNKLLKLVNSAIYNQFNQKGVSSVSNAMVIMGTNQIQKTAASLMLFEHMQASAQNQDLKDIAMVTFMSGLMAKDLAGIHGFKDPEEFQVCGMFHKLGENLIAYYFPEKFRLIRDIEKSRGILRDEAAKQILGISFQTMGTGVARKWGLPSNIVQSMSFDLSKNKRHPEKKTPRSEFLGRISSFSNILCDIQRNPSPSERGKAITALLKDYQGLIALKADDIDSLIKHTSERLTTHAAIMNVNISNCQFFKNMQQRPSSKTKNPDDVPEDKPLAHDIARTIQKEILRIEQKMTGDFHIGEILMDILHVMHTYFNYDRIAICIKDLNSNTMVVRHGLGKNVDSLIRNFHFPLSKKEDIFHLSLLREKDYTIHNVDDAKYKSLIPDWYRRLKLSKGFDLYSLVIDHVPLGFFYADRETIVDHTPMEQQKSMKKLRSLAEKAIRIKKGLS